MRPLCPAFVAAAVLASACVPMAPVTVTVELGGFNLDAEVKAIEDAACADAISSDCAVLSALSNVPWSVDRGPIDRPFLPDAFASMIAVPDLADEVDVADWYADFSHQNLDEPTGPCDAAADDDGAAAASCSVGRHRRITLDDAGLGTIEPEAMADAVIERAVVVRNENDSLALPPLQFSVGREGEPSALLARSQPFDVGGVAVLETDADAMVMLSEAVAEDGGFVEFGTIDDAVPGLVMTGDGRLRRPGGALRLSLVLHLQVPLTALAGTLQAP
jgi:hypothetical protein